MKHKSEILAIERAFSKLKESHGFDIGDVIQVLHIRKENIPVSIFRSSLGPSEAIVKYLREKYNLKYNQISFLLNKDKNVVGVSYRNSLRKLSRSLDEISDVKIPLSELSDSRFTIFELTVAYLKKTYTYRKIAGLLNRDERTIWTVYNRYLKKNENK